MMYVSVILRDTDNKRVFFELPGEVARERLPIGQEYTTSEMLETMMGIQKEAKLESGPSDRNLSKLDELYVSDLHDEITYEVEKYV